MSGIRLNRFPNSAKILLTLFLAAVAANHIFSGVLAYYVTHESFSSTEEYYHYQQDTRKLLRMSHQHAFGHGIMYLALGGMLCFSGIGEKKKIALIAMPFAGAGIDLASWWLIKFKGPHFEVLSYIAGSIIAFSVAASSIVIFYELWLKKADA